MSGWLQGEHSRLLGASKHAREQGRGAVYLFFSKRHHRFLQRSLRCVRSTQLYCSEYSRHVVGASATAQLYTSVGTLCRVEGRTITSRQDVYPRIDATLKSRLALMIHKENTGRGLADHAASITSRQDFAGGYFDKTVARRRGHFSRYRYEISRPGPKTNALPRSVEILFDGIRHLYTTRDKKDFFL